jgi:hypothetical protein
MAQIRRGLWQNELWSLANTPLHQELEEEAGRGVLTEEAFGAVETGGVEEEEWCEVEGKPT